MKRFEFPLDKVLRAKRYLERQAEARQLQAQRAADAARAELAGLRDELRAAGDRLARAVGTALTPPEWAAAVDRGERLGEAVRGAERRVAAAEDELRAAARARAQAAAEVEALATLRADRFADWRQEAQAADQERLDEVGLRRWLKARAPTPPSPEAAP